MSDNEQLADFYLKIRKASFDCQVGKLVDEVLLKLTSNEEKQSAIDAMNKVICGNDSSETIIQDFDKPDELKKKLISAIGNKYQDSLNKMDDFLKYVQDKNAGLPDNNLLKTYKIQKKQVSKAPPPITPWNYSNSGYYKEQHYAEKVSDSDYTRCITSGYIEVNHLAALACDLSPPHQPRDNEYKKDLENTETQIGLNCQKLVKAIKSDAIKTSDSKLPRYCNILLSDGVNLLEKEGISVSGRLKEYVTKAMPAMEVIVDASVQSAVKPFKGKSGAKTKYPDAAYKEMRVLINNGADSITAAATEVAPNYKQQSLESTIKRLTQTYNRRISKIPV